MFYMKIRNIAMRELALIADFETTSVNITTARILSAGLVLINLSSETILSTFYWEGLIPKEDYPYFVEDDPSTMDWIKSTPGQLDWYNSLQTSSYKEMTKEFEIYLTAINSSYDLQHIRLVGNGPDFDNVLLHRILQPTALRFNHQKQRDLRTYREIAQIVTNNKLPFIQFEGRKHHAMDDALNEAKELLQLWKIIQQAHI